MNLDSLLDTTVGRVVAVLAGLGLLVLLVALQQLWRARSGPYWRMRRNAGQRGGQLFLVALTLFGLAAAVAVFGGLGSLALNEQLEGGGPVALVEATPETTARLDLDATVQAAVAVAVAATLDALPTPTPPPPQVIVVTPTASRTATATATTRTRTPTASITPTASATLTPDLSVFDGLLAPVTPAPNAPTALPDASLTLSAIAPAITLDAQPRDAADRLPSGLTRLYVFYEYARMTPGTTWTYLLYYDGQAVAGRSARWEDEADGSGFVFLTIAEGLPPGPYMVRLYIGGREADRMSFTVEAA